MTTATIEQRLSEPEGKQLEFKRDLSLPKPLMKTLVAFANTAGGQLIIGVDDDGTVLGVDDPLDMEERPGMTIEDMKRGVSMIRNPVIARVFRELGLIEQWGSGVKRIFSEAQVQGLPEPRIEEVANRLRFIVPLEQLHAGQGVTQSRPESRPESGLADRILQCLVDRPLGKAEIAKSLGHKGVSGQLKRQMTWLQNQQLIEMTLPEKPNSRLQQYRLTPKGQRFLQDTFKDLT